MRSSDKSQGRQEGMESPNGLSSFEEVRETELERIRQRRLRAEQRIDRDPKGNGRPNSGDGGESAETDPRANLVGISLSGGGIRSGAFSLGVLMGLCRGGLLRFVDYVSTVSGGGYAAAALSAESVEEGKRGDRHDQPNYQLFQDPPEKKSLVKARTADNPARPYPRTMLELVSLGSRWLRDRSPYESLNRFFIGGLATLLFTVCLMAAACALLAWCFRWLNYAPVYDWLQSLGIEGDILVPLTPSFVLFGLWLLCWIMSLADNKRRATGKVARYVFRAWVVATILGLVLVATSGVLDIHAILNRWGLTEEDKQSFKILEWILPAVIAAIITCLIPYVRPDLLLRSSRRESGGEHYLFLIARAALLWGVPLLLFAFFASENISGWNARRDARFGDSDLERLRLPDLRQPILLDQMQAAYDADREDPSAREPKSDEVIMTARVGATQLEFSAPLVGEQSRKENDAPPLVLPGTYLLTGLTSRTDLPEQQSNSLGGDEPRLLRYERLRSEAGLAFRGALSRRATDEDLDALLADNSWGDERSDLALYSRLLGGLAYLLNFDSQNDAVARASRASRASRLWQRELLYAINQRMLYANLYKHVERNLARLRERDPDLKATQARGKLLLRRINEARVASDNAMERPDRWFLTATKIEGGLEPLFETIPDDLSWHEVEDYSERRASPEAPPPSTAVKDRLRHIHTTPAPQTDLRPLNTAAGDLTPVDIDERQPLLRAQQARRDILSANRDLLEVLYPEAIRPLKKHNDDWRLAGGVVYSRHVLLKDQQVRWWIFVWTAGAALVAALVMDLNTLSWHGYYAERLASFWVRAGEHRTLADQGPRSENRILLHELNTVNAGRPYHLINACALSFARRASSREDIAGIPIDPFLLSEQFVGADLPPEGETPTEIPGYARTSSWRYNQLSLSDAVAFSGAAVSPWATPNQLARMAMFVLNLRTGMWLPNPRRDLAYSDSLWNRILHRASFFPPIRFASQWLRKANSVDWSHVSVTDGGFYENLGLEPLLRRRCRVIIAVDATQDEEYFFDALANVVRRCRMLYGFEFIDPKTDEPLSIPGDLAPGTEADLNGTDWKKSQSQFCAVRVVYGSPQRSIRNDADQSSAHQNGHATDDGQANGTPSEESASEEPTTALLILVKATLGKNLPLDLARHARRNKQFPNDPTSDQFYTSEKFESYRQLGDMAASQIIEKILKECGADNELLIDNQTDLITKLDKTFFPQKPKYEPRLEYLTIDELFEKYFQTLAGPSPSEQELKELDDQIDVKEPTAILSAVGHALRELISGAVPPFDPWQPKSIHWLMEKGKKVLKELLKGKSKNEAPSKGWRDKLRKDPVMCDWPAMIDDWRETFAAKQKDFELAAELLEKYKAAGLCQPRGEECYLEEVIERLHQ